MAGPAPGALLELLDAGALASPAERALLLLRGAGRAEPTVTVSERDQQILSLRETLFGDAIEAVERCPACGAQIELRVPVAALRTPPAAAEVTVEADGYRVSARALTAGDLADAAATGDAHSARALLVARAVVHAELDGAPVTVDELPEPVVSAIAAALSAADPGVAMELGLHCDGCGTAFARPFDAASFLWKELEAWAADAMWEVHTLAHAYGWTEREVLALPAWRRRWYVEAVANG